MIKKILFKKKEICVYKVDMANQSGIKLVNLVDG